jgi:hypothetical protein
VKRVARNRADLARLEWSRRRQPDRPGYPEPAAVIARCPINGDNRDQPAADKDHVMSIANKLLKLAAKVALDRLLGDKRADELVNLLDDWKAERDKDKELAEAKKQAASSEAVREAVKLATEEAPRSLTNQELDSLELTVAAGLASLERPPTETELWEVLLPGTMKTYVVLSDDPRLTGGGSGRFFHFNWSKEGYRVRDYLGGRILHPADSRPRRNGLTPVSLDMTALGVWSVCKVRIHSTQDFGLGFDVKKCKEWVCVLSLLTEATRQLGET